jgi:two-component system vancomycin resistance associated response regulator VraR
MPYDVMIVDDQRIPRHYFELIVQSSDRYRLRYSIESAAVAYAYCTRFHFDLIILDILMNDGSNGLDAAERIKRDFPAVRILMVTSMMEASFLRRAREIGVDSFWYKEAGELELLEVMDRTMAGESVYPDSTPLLMIGSASSAEFTPSELVVLREMTKGLSNKDIAEKLVVEVSTVKKHISNMLQKTGFSNRTELAIEARVRGLVIGEKQGKS